LLNKGKVLRGLYVPLQYHQNPDGYPPFYSLVQPSFISRCNNMINDGISTEIVRKVLGHGTKYALRHYARIDVESMRLCPLPTPEPTGEFARLLFPKGVKSAHV